ncbi:hypothetical protein V5N11_003922 [Cardamine amara subsp. amara]|uniref:Ribosomal RNA-processing protein 7 C-terminal domain-containing protein n=1 Tax=Cardamine amara subsp. amara TaxID=228776 RepID=A0ABD1A682_CARAN
MKETRKLKKRNLQDANSSEKPKIKKLELKKKKKKMAEEINSSPVDSKLSEKMKKRKLKGSNVDISKQSQPRLEATLDEKVKGKKGKMNKTKKKRKAEEISSASVDDEDDHLKCEGKSKKSNKKKKMDLTSTKENEKSSDKINEIEEAEDVYQISSGDEDCSKGMKKWVTDYYESRPGLDELQQRIDDFMAAHEERLDQEKQTREAKAAEGGWTVVVHHKGRKKTTETETGTTVGSVSQAALEDKVAKKKQNEPVAHGFYRFQRREAQRNELLALQSKFEQDKKRIQQLRAARKFKPH